MKKLIRRIVNKAYHLVNKQYDPLLLNVFDKQYSKRVLVSYIIAPFVSGINDRHTNLIECYTACKIFDELEFIVDVVNYNEYSDSINFNNYNVVYGFGESFEKLFYWAEYSWKGSSIKKIVYATGCDTVFSNRVSLQRVFEFYQKENIFCINSARVVNTTWRAQIIFSDLIISLGNKFVSDTYLPYSIGEISNVNIFFRDLCEINVSNKNFKNVRTNFLWWGSAGAIHKGLDIIISVFERNPNINLYICGFIDKGLFSDYLDNKVNKCSNIKNLGFVQVGSEEHASILNNCIATILPSASEGGAAGIVNACSTAGLIPIITKSCGLNVPEIAKGFLLNATTERELEKAISVVCELSEQESLKMCTEIQKYFRLNHNFESYKKNLKQLIRASVTN